MKTLGLVRREACFGPSDSYRLGLRAPMSVLSPADFTGRCRSKATYTGGPDKA